MRREPEADPRNRTADELTSNSRTVIDRGAQPPGRALQGLGRSDAAGTLRTTVPRGREDGRSTDGPGGGLAAGRLEASWRPEAGRAGARPPRRASDALQRPARRA